MVDAQLIRQEDLPIGADELRTGGSKKNTTSNESTKVTEEQLEQMKNDPLLVVDSEKKELFKYGDLNGDKKLDDKDAASLAKLAKDGANYNKQADLNGDKVVNQDDIDLFDSYLKGDIPSFPVYSDYDSDNDGLNDLYETVLFHSDRLKADTDGDGLSDLEEVFYTNTDPLVSDSAVKGTSDAEVDLDGDGLTNIREVKLGSSPNNTDTDADGLDDGYEVNKTKTSPVKADTDGDGLTDFEEKELGLDPLKTATNGTPDNERVFTQSIPKDDPIFADINTDENAYELSVEIKASGYANNNLSVVESGYSYALKDSSAIGIAPQLIYNDDFKVESITLNFEIKEAFRDNVSHYFDSTDGDYYDYEYEIDPEFDGIKRLNVFKYFQSINLVMPLYTEYDVDNNTVSVTINTFEKDDDGNSYGIGSYSLVDLEVWGNMMNELSAEESASGSAVDTQGFIRSESAQISADSSMITVRKKLPELSDEKRDTVVKNYQAHSSESSSDEASDISALLGHRYAYYDASGISWADAQAACRAMGGHLMTVNSPFEFSYLNGELSNGRSGGLYWLGASGGSGNWSWVTGESTSYARTISVYGYTMDNCYDYFGYLGNKLAYCPALDYASVWTPSEASIKGYICEWEPGAVIKDKDKKAYSFRIGGGKTVMLKAPLSASSGVDSDEDGITDWDEVDHTAIKKMGGKDTDTSVSWNTASTYLKNSKAHDSNLDGADKKYEKIIDKSFELTPTLNDIQGKDSDGDGIIDSKDMMPNDSYINIFNCFTVTEEFKEISTNDSMDELAKRANSVYNSLTREERDSKIDHLNDVVKRANINTLFGDVFVVGTNASKFLSHFLGNSGDDYFYDASDLVEYTSAKKFYIKNMNSVREFCESTVNDSLYFTTLPSTTQKECQAADFSDANSHTLSDLDWWFSVGSCGAAISVNCKRDGNRYTADVRYYVLDYYDWKKDSDDKGLFVTDGEMYELHEAGIAREFKSVGCFTKRMSWFKGERIN